MMRARIERSHLERRAFVDVRQSTTMQVYEHGESTVRQYALARRAESLGSSRESIEVGDEDLGRSGVSTEAQSGFARPADAAAHGQVGAVFAIEMSRLVRSSQDWHRLLSLRAVAPGVVVDEQTVCDPNDKVDTDRRQGRRSASVVDRAHPSHGDRGKPGKEHGR